MTRIYTILLISSSLLTSLTGCTGPASLPLCTTPPTEIPCDKGCSDKVKDAYDTDVDCGGMNPFDGTSWCGPCADGKACIRGEDCQSRVCVNQTCRAASCADRVQNGAETDVDCGGDAPATADGGATSACLPCAAGKKCARALDCASQICESGVCSPSLCGDGALNAAETDVDCGGPVCDPCRAGKKCLRGSDCVNKTCFNNVCE